MTSPHPPVYYINLRRRPGRRRLQERQAHLHRMQMERIEAVDGLKLPNDPSSPLTPGARGIWQSYEHLVDRLAQQRVEWAVVLEDDAVLIPRFIQVVATTILTAPPAARLIQLGHLGDSSWRANNSWYLNVKKVLRPRSRLRQLVGPKEKLHGGFYPSMRAGLHALLINPVGMKDIWHSLDQTLPLDVALVEYSRSNLGELVRCRRNLAFQLPVSSDIPWT